MRLFRYLATFYAGVLAVTLSVLVIIVVAVTLVESAGKLSETEEGSAAAAELALYATVQFSYQILPVACLLAALAAGTLLARRGELMAIFAAGIGPTRVLISFGVVVLLSAGVSLALADTAVPWATTENARARVKRPDALRGAYDRAVTWYQRGDLLAYFPMVDIDAQEILSPVLYRVRDSEVVEISRGRKLVHDARGWWLLHAARTDPISGTTVSAERMPVALDVSPEGLLDVASDPRQLRNGEVQALIQRRAQAGLDTTAHRIERHQRYAFPLSCLWMFLLIAPFVARPSRKRSLAVNLGLGVIAVAGLLYASQVFRMLALADKVPPWVGAWLGGGMGLLLLPVSLWLAHRQRVLGGT